MPEQMLEICSGSSAFMHMDSRDMSSGYGIEDYLFTTALTDMIDFIDQMEEAMGSCHG